LYSFWVIQPKKGVKSNIVALTHGQRTGDQKEMAAGKLKEMAVWEPIELCTQAPALMWN